MGKIIGKEKSLHIHNFGCILLFLKGNLVLQGKVGIEYVDKTDTEKEREVGQMLTFADKGGRGVGEMLTLADEGGRGVWTPIISG